MEFSLHEKRCLAQMEQELSTDGRLVAVMRILTARRPKPWQLLRYSACRIRRPRLFTAQHRGVRLALMFMLCLTVATPVVLIVALATKMSLVAVIAVSVAPLPPLLLVFAGHRTRRSGTART
jgi:membrane-anchored protein YejM (alkaline phosphatase superfamily)